MQSSSGLLFLGLFCPRVIANQALRPSLLSEIVFGVICDGIELGFWQDFIDGDVVVKCLRLCCCIGYVHM